MCVRSKPIATPILTTNIQHILPILPLPTVHSIQTTPTNHSLDTTDTDFVLLTTNCWPSATTRVLTLSVRVCARHPLLTGPLLIVTDLNSDWLSCAPSHCLTLYLYQYITDRDWPPIREQILWANYKINICRRLPSLSFRIHLAKNNQLPSLKWKQISLKQLAIILQILVTVFRLRLTKTCK